MADIELCMKPKWCRDEALAEAAARWAEKKAEPVRKSDRSDVERLDREVIQQNVKHPYHGRMWQYLKDNW